MRTIRISTKEKKLEDMTLPATMERDALWCEFVPGPQLEFVVDNQSLADLANIHAKVTNDFYRPSVDRIRTNIQRAFAGYFSHKAGYLDPVDWRPREFNCSADLVADCAIASKMGYQHAATRRDQATSDGQRCTPSLHRCRLRRRMRCSGVRRDRHLFGGRCDDTYVAWSPWPIPGQGFIFVSG